MLEAMFDPALGASVLNAAGPGGRALLALGLGGLGASGDDDDDGRARTKKSWLQANLPLVAGGGVAVVALLGVAGYLLMNRPPPPEVVLDQVNQAVREASTPAACLQVTPGMDAARRVTLAGFAEDQAAVTRLVERIRAVPGVADVSTQVSILVGTHCRALVTLAAFQAPADGPKIAVRGAPTLRIGDFMVLDVEVGAREGHVYVFFHDRPGKVFLLTPRNADEHMKPSQAGSRFTLGGDPSGTRYRLAEPAGQQLATVLVSQTPLFATLPDRTNDAAPALEALRQALAQRNGRVEVNAVWFETVR